MDEIVHYTPDLQGNKSELFPGDAEVVILRDDPSTACATLLVRLPAGGRIESHSHFGVVQHLVLSGQYESSGGVFQAGTYRVLPYAAEIPPITSREGATILILYEPFKS